MATITVKELKQSGAQSATWFVRATDDTGSTEIILDQTDFAALPSGKLKSFLTTPYTGTDTEFVADFAAEGGAVVVTTRDDSNVPVIGITTESELPVIRLYRDDSSIIGASAVRVSVSYSASE